MFANFCRFFYNFRQSLSFLDMISPKAQFLGYVFTQNNIVRWLDAFLISSIRAFAALMLC